MLFGHIRRNAAHLKLAGGAVCQMKRKGVYAWETVRFDRICECVSVSVCAPVWGCNSIMWLFAFAGERVFIWMCLLTGSSVPGPAHLLTSPNWWHHRNSMIRLFLIAAAIAAVTVAMGRPDSLSLSHTHTQAFSWSNCRASFLTILTAGHYGCQSVDRNNCCLGRSGF